MSSDLKTLVNSKPVVLLLNSVDPYCHEIKELFEKYNIPGDKITVTYVDDVSDGPDLERQSLTISKSFTLGKSLKEIEELRTSSDETETEPLPHVYLGGEFFFGGQVLKRLPPRNTLRNKLVEVGALTLGKIEETKEIVSKSKLVCFLNSYSPFCFRAVEILKEYHLPDDEKVAKYVYTDKTTSGDQLGEAALYLGKCDKLPVIFIDGKPFGSTTELEACHKSYKFEDELVKAGVYKTPAYKALEEQKNKHLLLVIGNKYSAFCITVREIIAELKISADKFKIFDDETKERKDLHEAAKFETKQQNAPYIYLAGEFIATNDFIEMNKNKTLEARLKEKDVL